MLRIKNGPPGPLQVRLNADDEAWEIWPPRQLEPVDSGAGIDASALVGGIAVVAALCGAWKALLALVGLVCVVALLMHGVTVWATRGLCWLGRTLGTWWYRWWRGAVLVLGLSMLGSGCTDVVNAVAHLNGYKGDVYATPCAPDSLKAGTCMPAKPEGTKP